MAFRAPHSMEKAPKCVKCGSGACHVRGTRSGGHVWICTSCEYKARYPDAPMIPAAPNARRALPLQSEALFTD